LSSLGWGLFLNCPPLVLTAGDLDSVRFLGEYLNSATYKAPMLRGSEGAVKMLHWVFDAPACRYVVIKGRLMVMIEMTYCWKTKG
jgi:hypothetical protein